VSYFTEPQASVAVVFRDRSHPRKASQKISGRRAGLVVTALFAGEF